GLFYWRQIGGAEIGASPDFFISLTGFTFVFLFILLALFFSGADVGGVTVVAINLLLGGFALFVLLDGGINFHAHLVGAFEFLLAGFFGSSQSVARCLTGLECPVLVKDSIRVRNATTLHGLGVVIGGVTTILHPEFV